MSSYAHALAAAQQAVAGQSLPKSSLYMVATPIGNLADITLRALHVLHMADSVACEDTRHTLQLLRAYGIEKRTAQLVAVHQHNEREGAQEVMRRLQEGERVAYVSDAGTPGVSDPGAILAAEALQAGARVVPIPGASSVVAAISAVGFARPVAGEAGFVFAGFLPPKAKARDAQVQQLAHEARAVVLLEAPHRIVELAQSLALLGKRQITLARELTKQFEQIHTLPAADAASWLAQDASRTRGEFVVVVHPQQLRASSQEDESACQMLQDLLAEGVSVKSAAKLVTQWTGKPRKQVYDWALAIAQQADEQA